MAEDEKVSAEEVVRDIRRQTRRKYSVDKSTEAELMDFAAVILEGKTPQSTPQQALKCCSNRREAIVPVHLKATRRRFRRESVQPLLFQG